MSLREMCSLRDTIVLRKLILENPDLPILVFCGEESWSGEYSYEQADINRGSIRELTLYKDEWLDKDDYREKLASEMADDEQYNDLSDYDFFNLIDEKVKETEFVKAIVIYIG